MLRKTFVRGAAMLLFVGALSLTSSFGWASIVRNRIYRPDPMPAEPRWSSIPAPETVTVTTADGLVVHGYRWPAATRDHMTLVFFHGNGGNRYTAAQMAAPLRRPDVEIIVASYRGYGDNPGTPSEAGLIRDGTAFLALARQSAPRKVYLFGYSLGGGVALRLAADDRVDGVVTLATFSSLDSVAPTLVRGLLPDHFDNIAAVRRLTVPLLMLHGTADDTVPFSEGTKLKAAAGTKARFLHLEGAPHAISLATISTRVWQEIEAMPVVAKHGSTP